MAHLYALDNHRKKEETKMSNIYTYEFTYDEFIDGFGVIQFCAENKKEAESLFDDFCKENNFSVPEYSVDIVYNEDDAREYGDKYGVKS